MKNNYRFNGVQLTNETIQKTRKWFHDNALACIKEAEEGKVFVNDLEKLKEWKLNSANEYLEGKNDHIFTFLQRAYFIQTGESVPMLSF